LGSAQRALNKSEQHATLLKNFLRLWLFTGHRAFSMAQPGHFLTMTILIRTPRGNDALRNANTSLARRTKTLLIAIDGKTDSSLYIASLWSFGDVPALLEMLLRDGLVRALGPVVSVVPIMGNPAHSGAASGHVSTWFQTTAQCAGDVLSWNDTYPVPLAPGNQTFDDMWELDESPQAPVGHAASHAEPDFIAQQQLRNAVLLMHKFIATHLAKRSAELVPVIDTLTSVEQIARRLKDYEAWVAPAGKAATQHLLDLRATLTRR
jgi:hypothetical protein